jgi:hypothetical protein
LHDSKLGIVDHFFIPKRPYYAFREAVLMQTDDDNPIQGTATKVSLEPDLTYLRADGTDISCITIVIRDDNGKCINSDASVTLTLSGSSCIMFGPERVNAIAGKVGVVVRSTETVGATTVSAASNGLAGMDIEIATYSANDETTSLSMAQTRKPVTKSRVSVAPLLSLLTGGISALRVSKESVVKVYDMSGRLVTSTRGPVHPGLPGKFPSGVYIIRTNEVDNK